MSDQTAATGDPKSADVPASDVAVADPVAADPAPSIDPAPAPEPQPAPPAPEPEPVVSFDVQPVAVDVHPTGYSCSTDLLELAIQKDPDGWTVIEAGRGRYTYPTADEATAAASTLARGLSQAADLRTQADALEESARQSARQSASSSAGA